MILEHLMRLALWIAMIGIGWASADRDDEGIVGSKHDFSQYGWSRKEICLPCHTPHAASAPDVAPLWDHAAAAPKSYTLYDGGRGQPGPGSLVCLSCHDGSTAIDAYGGMSGDVFIHDLGGERALVGGRGDLRGDHPVGIPYPEFDREYRPKAQVEGEGYVVLPEGRVECISCHDAHNRHGADHLLVVDNERSGLCLSCHRK